MSHKSFVRFRAISIAIFVIGAVSVGLAYSLKKQNGPQSKPRKGFTLKSRDTSMLMVPRPPIPGEITHSSSIRYQRSDGAFKVVTLYYDANDAVRKKTILFGIPGQGVFSIDNPKGPLEFVSGIDSKEEAPYIRIYDPHKHPNFLRDDWVKGYQTHVIRFPDQDGGYDDLYYAPELNGLPIMQVGVSPGGVTLTEVVQVTLGDPDDKFFGGLPDLLITYDLFKSKIATMEERGKQETAEAMRRQLDEQVAKQMDRD